MSTDLQTRPSGAVARVAEAARLASHWRLLLLWLLALALPVLLMTLPVAMALSDRLSHSMLSSQLVDGFELTTYIEALMILGQNNFSPVGGGLAGLVLTLLLSPWLTGMVIASARSPMALTLGGLIKGGLNEYGRMARMLVWAVVPLGLAGAVVGGLMKASGHHAEQAILESDAELWGRLALLVSALVLLLMHASVDAARAQLAVEPRRSSVVLAWWRASKQLLRNPGRVMVYLLFTAIGLAAAGALALARLHVPAASGLGFVAALLLGQLLVLALAWMRCARLFALIQAAKA